VCRSFIYLLFQPTSIAKATVPEILFPYYRFRSLTSLATPDGFNPVTEEGYNTTVNIFADAAGQGSEPFIKINLNQ
jgi:hypothetical protein